ncbi:S41 family peptidase [Chitinophaga nivalis]|uniref:S41 family peptidase n=1 Tax=Chitinophaga nivalis TaxID=2991709 RepID=A0ABT3ILL6_9BACT|nr:S41 family peptidase [Chitinophaga nivalis]MCW3465455.1 S41 family peptidase [Chitinophaga nivalis]MCW3484853.1 S41 family peptidase [Chitinophaga nivalis]
MHKKLFTTGTKAILTGIACAALLAACKKGNDGGSPAEGVAEDTLKYLTYQIMQVSYADGGRNAAAGLPTYYWYGKVPQLNPLDSKYPNADTLLARMKEYAINPATNQPFDHYSFLDRDGSLTNRLMNGISSQTFAAGSGGYGLDYGLGKDQNGKIHIYVLYADKNSPAGQKGITRGWEVTAVNGTTVFNESQVTYNMLNEAFFYSSSIILGLKKPNGETTTATLNTGSYAINPVLFDTVFTVKDKPVGYFALYTYSSVINSDGAATATKTALDETFAKFKARGITNLIVDLRYNGGGATNTAEYLDNAIAPAAAAGKLMYTSKYNDKLTEHLSTVGLKASVNFAAATGGLKLDHVFFITTGNTASSSELTLNNLDPYMDVKLVGEKTYGKPVGFIDFTISMYDASHNKKYLADLYAINFETFNANGKGGYYTGIDVDAPAVDYVNVPWGNTDYDDNLLKIISFLETNSFSGQRAAKARIAAANDQLRVAIPGTRTQHGFNGMVNYEVSKAVSRFNR